MVLDPQWVTDSVYDVLTYKGIADDGRGIFTRDHMNDVWAEVDGDMRDHFLRLMERFDLSYRTLDDKTISIYWHQPTDTSDFHRSSPKPPTSRAIAAAKAPVPWSAPRSPSAG